MLANTIVEKTCWQILINDQVVSLGYNPSVKVMAEATLSAP
jgi:hypothetical protein